MTDMWREAEDYARYQREGPTDDPRPGRMPSSWGIRDAMPIADEPDDDDRNPDEEEE